MLNHADILRLFFVEQKVYTPEVLTLYNSTLDRCKAESKDGFDVLGVLIEPSDLVNQIDDLVELLNNQGFNTDYKMFPGVGGRIRIDWVEANIVDNDASIVRALNPHVIEAELNAATQKLYDDVIKECVERAENDSKVHTWYVETPDDYKFDFLQVVNKLVDTLRNQGFKVHYTQTTRDAFLTISWY